MLDYCARNTQSPDRWKACQMKTGLFLWEQQGRVVFIRVVANLLYTYELLCKFRMPRRDRHNIFIEERPSFARGPPADMADKMPSI